MELIDPNTWKEERRTHSRQKLSCTENCELGCLRVRVGYSILLQEPLQQLLGSLRVGRLAFQLETSSEIVLCLIELERQSLVPHIDCPNVPEATQAHERCDLSVQPELLEHPFHDPRGPGRVGYPPRLGGAGTAEGRVDVLLVLLDAADAADQAGLGLEGDDAAGVGVVEADAEDGEAGGELPGGAVEEEVLLEVGAEVVGGEGVREATVGGGVGETELHLDLHRPRAG
ncbi:unnamed protein product [Musa acuminata var. zebrina]